MTPRRILVTGAAGFVGRHLLPALTGHQVLACGSAPGMVALDVTDADAVAALVRRFRPDACVHLAAISAIAVARDDPDLAWRVNLHGTLALARALRREAPGCTLLFAGSGEAYGRSFLAGRALDETAPLAPANTYAATKAAADLALGAMAQDGLRVVRLRPFNHTGPGQASNFAVTAFARQVARIGAGLQKPVMRVGNLDPLRDYLDVRDVCAAYAACIDRAAALAPGTILNIASGTPRRIGDVLDALVALGGHAIAVETDPALVRRNEIALAAGDAGAARAALGWAPAIAWDRTLADVLADWRARVAADPAA